MSKVFVVYGVFMFIKKEVYEVVGGYEVVKFLLVEDVYLV